ncbi:MULTISPECIES: riboflavin synthase [unclassified Brevundimonas]|uniref:riboflavin synthase n=1 Tax=unclassified Brevundimonas TaxID=2622653 RepID=UPI000CFBAA71|nr:MULTISPECIES: riboflavin synthase [unclassified Brevundimonas]PRA36004.1 riboflavin synthase [Brevundimonas sp. MYb27]PQZ84495.1 riboflavin synthase [Brevundimonas sp. MYb31]PRB17730.1 riboflavin synthase [Brevundimonas sp. MYb52]PRB38101.1 riboflavin synthase [Brevundimonas sp. MYb46]PRB56117.1 riboflavin synthase [Brevundimonas sp. MYb33]
MFTGIVTDIGRVRSVRQTDRDRRYEVETVWDTASIDLGASISHAGCCLTVTEKGEGWFAVEVSGETLSKTKLGDWAENTRVNLERAARLGDELGGHIVSGHVDGLGEVVSITPEGGSHRIVIEAPAPLHRFIAPKGSITVDGVSLTVNGVQERRFDLNIIPHTWDATTLGGLTVGDKVNLEIDMLARYLARWQETA